ncbi:HIT domain-containing protein [Stutzerimonas azotifigens]|uniref:HIT domain-containing protein n=1 Tax=Stutzerimonas azotifigens TaxID=291995 RepID=UPI00041ACAFD|nr:HIT domain-containing protein [Stutzerimonas azotifigens]
MFELDPQLARDTLMLGDLPLSRLLLMNDARYPWFILVPRREEVTEVFQLDAADQARLWGEVAMLAEKIKDTFGAQKMNIASLGNMVPQMHVHVVARRRDDAAWPAPVWGRGAAVPYDAGQVASIRQKLKLVLTRDFTWSEA